MESASTLKEFQPPSIQNYNARYPQWGHRLIDKSKGNRRGDRLDYWLNQGWEIAPYGNAGMEGNRSTGASSMDNAVHYRGLVLIRAPWSLINGRNKFYREKHTRLMKAAEALRSTSNASGEVNSSTRRKLTSAFAESHSEKDGNVLEHSSVDTAKDPEKILRDVDPAALQEAKDRMAQMEEHQRKLEKENAELRREAEERAKKSTGRGRKSFPTS